MIKPNCLEPDWSVCGEICVRNIAADCIGGTTCQMKDPIPESIKAVFSGTPITVEELEEVYCQPPSNSCGGVLYDEETHSCLVVSQEPWRPVVKPKGDFACDSSFKWVWCDADQVCRDKMCFDLDELCASDRATVCSDDRYIYLKPEGQRTWSEDVASLPLRFICEDVNCPDANDEVVWKDGKWVRVKPEDRTTSAAFLPFSVGNFKYVLTLALAVAAVVQLH